MWLETIGKGHLFIVSQSLVVHLFQVSLHRLLCELDGLVAKEANARNIFDDRPVIFPIIRGLKLQFGKNIYRARAR
jgi:hypothetical protein